ncbi:hypothetical protein M5K25_011169 [Dendrobium thyrsiflorum]|uniref:Transmembrane protein n=1 Tax=Dendrobium thyrsiflorum TaxID=117978 RepID=A0ABD0V2D6_DENTH
MPIGFSVPCPRLQTETGKTLKSRKINRLCTTVALDDICSSTSYRRDNGKISQPRFFFLLCLRDLWIRCSIRSRSFLATAKRGAISSTCSVNATYLEAAVTFCHPSFYLLPVMATLKKLSVIAIVISMSMFLLVTADVYFEERFDGDA